MRRPARSPSFLALLPPLLGGCAAANTPEACRVARVAEVPIRMAGNAPLVEAEIGGKPARLLLDTGAAATLVSQDAFGRLGLEHDYTAPAYATGLGARTAGWATKPVPLRLGPLAVKPAPLSVVPIAWPPTVRNPPDGLLGGRTLAEYDLDIDIPRRKLTFYEPRNCPDGPPPFEGAAMTLRATNLGAYKLAVPIRIDGTEVAAEIDTGATRTLLDRQGLGLTEADLAADPAFRIATADPVGMAVRLHRFSRMQVGSETVSNPALVVGTTNEPGAAALLGTDYWRNRRLWLSYAGRAVTIGHPEPPRQGRPTAPVPPAQPTPP